MATAVRLTVLTGPHKNHRFCFCGPTRCHVGRASDCFVQLAGEERDLLISRHHCRLDVNPPSLEVCDMGSTNGTFLNGAVVESCLKELSEKAGTEVNHGDMLTIGGTTVRVDILECPFAGKAGETEIKDCPQDC